MVEVSGSTVAGALRVGLQIISAHRDPKIEIYIDVLNSYGPEHELDVPGLDRPQKHRFQDIRIQLRAVNIGGQRAERICFENIGTFARSQGRAFGGLFDHELPQMAPGQALQLCLLDQHELFPAKGSGDLTIRATYHSPPSVMNWLRTIGARIRGRPHHVSIFRINSAILSGDLPPATYS